MNPDEKKKIIEELRQSPIQKVKVAVTDIDGILRGKYLHKDKFLSAIESGFGFCNVVLGWDSSDVCYDNVKYTGWHTGYPDATAMIDLSTYRKVPWDGGIPFFLGDFINSSGKPLEVCPRQLLKKIITDASSMGYRPFCGMEFEWFNFKETPQSLEAKHYVKPEPLSPGMFGYSVIRASQNQPFFAALMDECLIGTHIGFSNAHALRRNIKGVAMPMKSHETFGEFFKSRESIRRL
jgi:glutamine synthetase